MPQVRQKAIIDLLKRSGVATYQDIASQLGVSAITARRGVNALAEQGFVIKIINGVQLAGAPRSHYELPLDTRLAENRSEKQSIAAEAVQHIEPSSTLFLDGSSTCLELARQIASRCHRLTVVTNSALVSIEVARGSDHQVVGIGGQFDPDSFCFVGPTCELDAERFHVDAAFFSTKGFVPAEGTFESSIGTFHVKQIVARQAEKVVLLADHSKWGRRSLARVLSTEQIDLAITDSGISAEALRQGEEVHLRTVVAGAEVACHAS